jgi:DNA-binding CsgD family transcriptional regulator
MEQRLVRPEIMSALETMLGDDLRNMPSVMGRLVWFSSMRNCHNGQYTHPTLSEHFTAKAVDSVLRAAHERSFAEWLTFTLEQQAADLALYFSGLSYSPSTIATTWRRLESFCHFVPERAPRFEKRLFACDIRALLEGLIAGPRIQKHDSERFERISLRSLTALSARELEILALIGSGNSTKEIAAMLSLSCHTVADHRKNICHKLGVHSTAELV